MKNLLNFENVVKLGGGLIAICGLYYALDKRLALIEQKVSYMVENYKEKEIEAKIELTKVEGKVDNNTKQLAELRERIIKIVAVLPKRIQLTEENEEN